MEPYLNQFHHQILGPEAAPKLVFLHGLMGSSANWRKVTSSLGNAYHILVFDQRGHGRSFQPKMGYRPEDYSDDLFKILNELGWDRVRLVGHSMGGRNALNFSHRWPQRVIGLVLEDIGPDASAEAVDRIEHLIGLVPTPFANRAEAKSFLLEKFPTLIPENLQAQILAQYFYSNMDERSDGLTDWRFSKAGVLESLRAGRERERWDELRGLEMPTLIVRGENSLDLNRPIYERMLRENPRLTGVEIAKAGHWVHSDQPEAFVTVLKNFLGGLPND